MSPTTMYYWQNKDKNVGPLTYDEIKALVDAKTLDREQWIASPGGAWQRAHEALPELFPEVAPPEMARAMADAAEQFGVASKAIGKVGTKMAGVAARFGVDTHMVKGLDKLSAAARSALRGTAERNPRLARELAEQFDANKKSLAWAFGYTVFGLLLVSLAVIRRDIYIALVTSFRTHSAGKAIIVFLESIFGFDGAFVMMLIGISIAAIRCLWWIFRDEFKAVAIGRKVFLVWMIISAFHTFKEAIPKSMLSAPAAALVKEQRSVPGPNGPTNVDVYVVPQASAEVNVLTWKDWAKGPIKETGKDLWGNYIILALLNTIYQQLRGLRPEFSWANFINLISFRLWFRFTEYDFDDVTDDMDVEPPAT